MDSNIKNLSLFALGIVGMDLAHSIIHISEEFACFIIVILLYINLTNGKQ